MKIFILTQLLFFLFNRVYNVENSNSTLPSQDWFIDQVFGNSTVANIDLSDLETIMDKIGILSSNPNGKTPNVDSGKSQYDKVCINRSNNKILSKHDFIISLSSVIQLMILQVFLT